MSLQEIHAQEDIMPHSTEVQPSHPWEVEVSLSKKFKFLFDDTQFSQQTVFSSFKAYFKYEFIWGLGKLLFAYM